MPFNAVVHGFASAALTTLAEAAGGAHSAARASMHADPLAAVLLGLAAILLAARLGGHLAVRLGQPAVLGELVAGIALGSLRFAGVDMFITLAADPAVELLARLGVLLLLFDVGLESSVAEMFRVGRTALFVAVLGVVGPLALGWLVSSLLLPEAPRVVHAFIGAALCATSVGITARVLSDLGRQTSTEARIILGAAVVDDVLGLVILAVVAGVVAGDAVSIVSVGSLIGRSAGFLAAALLFGPWLARRLFAATSRLRGPGVLLTTGLAVCFALSWLSARIGLAAIVGAFAAGLIIDARDPQGGSGDGAGRPGSGRDDRSVHDEHARARPEIATPSLQSSLAPIAQLLSPIFFVQMGLRTDLSSFASPRALLLAAALTVAAVIGKQVCSLAVPRRSANRLAVGIGMIPRGEVGLIFADAGAALSIAGQPVLGPAVYSAVVLMVVVTTVMTPPALKWALERAEAERRTK